MKTKLSQSVRSSSYYSIPRVKSERKKFPKLKNITRSNDSKKYKGIYLKLCTFVDFHARTSSSQSEQTTYFYLLIRLAGRFTRVKCTKVHGFGCTPIVLPNNLCTNSTCYIAKTKIQLSYGSNKKFHSTT